MITSIKIQNLIHFEDVELDFSDGLIGVTGESGAGKSIIIQAIQALSGKSIPTSWITPKGQNGFIEGLFTITAPTPDLIEYLDSDNLLVVRRYLSEGKSALAQLNGQTVTLKLLKTLISPLISTTAQHQQLALLDSNFLISLLDPKIDRPFEIEYNEKLENYFKISQQLDRQNSGANSAQHRSFLEYQIKELSALNLRPDEDVELKEKKERIQKLDKEQQTIRKLRHNFDVIQTTVLDSERAIQIQNDQLQYQHINQAINEISQHIEIGFDALSKIESEISQLEVEDIESIESRLDALFRIKSKTNLHSVNELIAHLDSLKLELISMENNSESIERLQKQRLELHSRLTEIGSDWARRRNHAASELMTPLKATLLKIGFPFVDIQFSVQFDSSQLSIQGGSRAEFKISTVPNRIPEPFGKIASGGELSRIFLALISVLNPQSTQTLVFDEIDSGIGGTTANEVGSLIHELSQTRQIICITHLPQIAKFAKTHYVVSKLLSGNELVGKVELVRDESRNQELRRMIGGSEVLSQLDSH